MKTIKELATEAYNVQDACNLSGVVHSFSRVFESLRALDECKGTDWINKHPVCVLYADKIAHLTGTQSLGNDAVMSAYDAIREMMR